MDQSLAQEPQGCNWQQFSNTWNSGSATTAELCILNQNTVNAGNDFALDDKLQLYPNPVAEQFTLKYEPGVLIKNISISDAQGKIILQPKIEALNQGAITISTSSLIKGIYFLQVATVKGIQTIKFVKQ